MKHGHGTKGATPVFDAAGRSDMRGMLLPARPTASCHMAFVFFKPTRTDAASIRADSRLIGPTAQQQRPVEMAELV